MLNSRVCFRVGALVLGALVMTASCGDDDGGTGDVCAEVDCGSGGVCVDEGGQPACQCQAGYHADGLTCVPDVNVNTAPEITSTPATDATELVLYTYAVSCTDADGDDLTLTLGAADTCGGSLQDDGDGTGTYRFTPAEVASDATCLLEVACQDASEEDLQTVTVAIRDVAPVCAPLPTFVGQVNGSTDPTTSNGGVLTTTPWDASYDSGIADLLALVPQTPGQSATVSASLTQATIVASYPAAGQERIYLADGNGAIRTFLTADASQLPAFLFKVGQRVSVEVTEVLNYEGVAEITVVMDNSWTLDSTDNEVVVYDHTGGPALTSADFNKLVRLAGTVMDSGTGCGSNALCYLFDYGAGENIVLRIFGQTILQGTCVTFLGPVSGFQNAPQLTLYGYWAALN